MEVEEEVEGGGGDGEGREEEIGIPEEFMRGSGGMKMPDDDGSPRI